MKQNDPVFRKIESDQWPRKPAFDYYYNVNVCTYSITAEIEIGNLLKICKEKSIKLYPALVYLISRAVNQISELATSFNEKGEIGFWSFLSPCYTVFHDDDKSFTNIWTSYNEDFVRFHQDYLQDLNNYGEVKDFIAKPNEPENTFPISCVPWVDFVGFNLNIYGDGKYLRPIFTFGKFTKHDNGVKIPLAAQLHHALCDGYHAGRLFELIRGYAAKPEEWI